MPLQRSNPYVVGPVMKALTVLAFIAERGHEVTLTNVSHELGIPKTTTFRYLQTLAEAGFVIYHVENDKYEIGPRFRTLARADTSLHNLRTVARPHMLQLLGEFDETVNLAVSSGRSHVVYIDIVESRRSVRVQCRVGDTHPLHSTALGKVMLAFMPEPERETYLAHPLSEMTGRTIIDAATLNRQLKQVARSGYATEISENHDGAMCVGAAIRDETNAPIAALSISAPTSRMSQKDAPRVGQCLVDFAARISGQLLHGSIQATGT